jgi:hypothetical protein
MTNDFKDYPINFLLAGLFLIAIISFGVNMAHNYGQDEALMKSDKIDFSGLENRINQTSADAQSWGETFKSDNLFVVAGGIVLYSIWGITKLVWNSALAVLSIFTDGASSLLGIPPVAIGVLTAIIIIGLIFSAWKLIKQGS